MDTKLLYKLINISGVSGNEEQVRDFIAKAIKPYVDEVRVDKFGNLLCRKKGREPRVMLAAHMDEIGLMVKSIDMNGAISFSVVGGIEAAALLAQRVRIPTNKGAIHGVITNFEMSSGQEIETIRTEDLYIDTGLDQAALLKQGVDIGNYIEIQGQSCEFCGNMLIGKALDDRIGCFILIELAKKLQKNKNEIVYVFSVQEEIGLYGAMTSVYEISPSWAIAVDVTEENSASETPSKFIGNGPTITAKDASMLGNKCINGWLKEIAKKNKIPVQMDVSDGGTTEALAISTSEGGVPVTVVGVAVRNLHSTIGIAHLNDVKNAIKLLELLLKNPPKTCLV